MNNRLLEIPLDRIDRDPAQPRTTFDETTLAELAESIRAHGVIQPVEVEETADGRYRLHHGERRVRASRMAGQTTIPAVVAPPRERTEAGQVEALVRGLLENLHREDLNPIDEARAYDGLVKAGWTQTRIARELGRSQFVVGSRLLWLKLEKEIQDLVALGHLPVDRRVAEALLVLPPEARVPLAEKMARQALSVKGCVGAAQRAAEAIARKAEARAAGRARHEESVAGIGSPGNGSDGRWPNGVPVTPMLALGVAGEMASGRMSGYLNGSGSANGRGPGANGSGPGAAAPVVASSIAAAAEAMCRSCNIRPRGDVIPAWEIVEAEARRTCASCQKKDGPARMEICLLCPGVDLMRRLLGATAVTVEE